MRSNLLKSVASVVAMLAMSAFVAGTALAEVTFGIQTDGSFGLYTNEEKSDDDTSAVGSETTENSQFTDSRELNLNMAGESGNVTWKGRFRARDDGGGAGGTLTTHRAYLGYKITDAATLEFHSRSFGGPSMAVGDISGVIGRFGFGDATAYIGWEDQEVLNFQFNAGAASVGFGISDVCLVGDGSIADDVSWDCGIFANDADIDNAGDAPKDQQSFILHANGAAGAIAWGFQYVSASGNAPGQTVGPDITDDDTEVSSSGFELGVKWSGPAQVGFTYTSVDMGCEKATGVTGVTCDPSESRMKIAVAAAGAKLAYTMQDIELEYGATGAAESFEYSKTNIDASYSIEVAPGVVIGPEVRIESAELTVSPPTGPGGAEFTQDQMLVAIAYSASF